MAKAKIATVTKFVPVDEEVLRLELSMEEAQFLHDVVRRIGGCPGGSRRAIGDRLERVLSDAKIPYRQWEDKPDYQGSIYFKTKEEMVSE